MVHFDTFDDLPATVAVAGARIGLPTDVMNRLLAENAQRLVTEK